jgi:hypothetical protein
MEMDGVTELRASTIRLMAFPSYRCRLTTVTVYACTDGSPYLYRIGSRFYAPMQFNNQYGDYYTLTRAGDIGPIFGTLPRLLPA